MKVIDFGTSVFYEKDRELLNKVQGTPFYIAPEVLNKNYDERCDVWSIGVILYILLSGKPPFNGNDENEILEKIKKGDYSMDDKIWNSISSEAK